MGLTVSGRLAEKRYERAYGAADRLPSAVAANARYPRRRCNAQ